MLSAEGFLFSTIIPRPFLRICKFSVSVVVVNVPVRLLSFRAPECRAVLRVALKHWIKSIGFHGHIQAGIYLKRPLSCWCMCWWEFLNSWDRRRHSLLLVPRLSGCHFKFTEEL